MPRVSAFLALLQAAEDFVLRDRCLDRNVVGLGLPNGGSQRLGEFIRENCSRASIIGTKRSMRATFWPWA
jgi:hypothetical protein